MSALVVTKLSAVRAKGRVALARRLAGALATLLAVASWSSGCDDSEGGRATEACSAARQSNCIQVPKTWFCETKLFAQVERGSGPNDAQCDCACGAFDPDCATDLAPRIATVSDHSKVGFEPGGDTSSAATTCKRCVVTDDAAGSACTP